MERIFELFTVENYQLRLDIDKEKNDYTGEVIISGSATNPTIKIDAVDFTNLEISQEGQPLDFSYDQKVITINNLALGPQKICIKFSHAINQNMVGIYLSSYDYDGHKERIISTQFESHYAREAFPCIDDPSAKATFDLAINSLSGDPVISNMPILAQNGNEFIFETTPRMSTYLLAFVIGRFQSITTTNKNDVKITTYAALNQTKSSMFFANEVAAKSLEYYDEKFGIRYPLKKLDQVAIPDFDAGAMENWGIVTYRESMFLCEQNDTEDTKKVVALTVAHELSHQWFGNLVTMKWWDDLWLNESFASIMEYYCVDAIYPELKVWDDFYSSDCVAALKRDSNDGIQAVYQPVSSPAEIDTLFDGAIVYAKGAHLMFMLSRMMGVENFFKGAGAYFEKFKYGNTSGDDLWSILNEYSDFNVKQFMHDWITKPGFPVFKDGKQYRFLNTGIGSEITNWPLPELKSDMSGHYLISLSESELQQKLAHFAELNHEEQVRLLIDQKMLASSPLLNSATLFDIIDKFQDEQNAAIWGLVVDIICYLEFFFKPHSAEFKNYQQYLQCYLRDKYQQYGAETHPGESSDIIRIRKTVLGLLFYAEDAEVIAKLATYYQDDYAKIDPNYRHLVLRAKLYQDNILEEMIKKYQQASDPALRADILAAMASDRHTENVDRLVSLLKQPEVVKPQDHWHFMIWLRHNPETKQKTFAWLKANWDYVKKMTGGKSIDDYPKCLAASIDDEAEFQEFKEFFQPMKEDPAYTRVVTVAENSIAARIKLIDSDAAAVHQKVQ